MAGTGLEQWRELFRGRDIYDVISKAIYIAATDSPKEFRRRRDGIVEQIYTAPAASTISTLQGRVVSAAGNGCSGSAALQVSDKGSKVASCTVAVAAAAPPVEEPDEKKEKKKEEGVADDEHGNGGNGDGDNVGERVDYAS